VKPADVGDAFTAAVPPVQSTRLPAGVVVAAGAAFTVTVAVAADEHPNALVTV
jgi:hypothetical protein